MYSYPPTRRIRRGRRQRAELRRKQLRRKLGVVLLAATLPILLGLYVVTAHSSGSHRASDGGINAGPALTLEQMATNVTQATPPRSPDTHSADTRATGIHAANIEAKKGNKSARLVYQYSVVPGGVRDVGELADAAAHDPSVARHYARLDFQHARLVRLRYSQKLYISYRRNGQILWTKTPHLIRAGEKVITDGKVTARTRCGNRLASKPRGLTAREDPTEAQLNEPVAVAGESIRPPVTLLAQNSVLMPPLVATGPPSSGPGGIPIGIGPPIGGGGIGSVCETEAEEKKEHDTDTNELICPKKHHPPPPSVPEPGTLVLVGSGIVALSRRYVMERLRSWTS